MGELEPKGLREVYALALWLLKSTWLHRMGSIRGITLNLNRYGKTGFDLPYSSHNGNHCEKRRYNEFFGWRTKQMNLRRGANAIDSAVAIVSGCRDCGSACVCIERRSIQRNAYSRESISDFNAVKCVLSVDCTPKQLFLATGRVPKILLCRILKLTCSLLGEREQHASERR